MIMHNVFTFLFFCVNRSKPVITVDVSIFLPTSINITVPQCHEGPQHLNCFNVTVCMRFRGKLVPGRIGERSVEVWWHSVSHKEPKVLSRTVRNRARQDSVRQYSKSWILSYNGRVRLGAGVCNQRHTGECEQGWEEECWVVVVVQDGHVCRMATLRSLKAWKETRTYDE